MAKEKRLIDARPLIGKGWHLVKTGKSNEFIGSMSLADVPTVDAVEVVHGRWKIEWEYERDSVTGECEENPVATCPFCGHKEWGFAYDYCWAKPYNYCPNCGAKMDGGNENGG